MLVQNVWKGTGDGYVLPSSEGQTFTKAHQIPRWGLVPLLAKKGPDMIMAGGPQNKSGQSSGQIHAGVETAEEKARRDNFKFN